MSAINIVPIPRPDQDTIWVSQEYGIRSRSEFERHANRSLLQTITDVGNAHLNGLFYVLTAGYRRCDALYRGLVFPKFNDPAPIGSSGKGLAIFFHGLGGQPPLWDNHIHLLKNTPDIEVFAPELPEEGRLSLTDDTSYALLNRIVDWTKHNPGKPLALFGQSNGTRLALLFEIWLRVHAPTTPVHLSLTAGVLYGSTTADLVNILGITLGRLSKVNCVELPLGSDTAKKLLEAARQPLPQGVAPRDYAMYSPLHDMIVPNTGSGLPILVPDGQESKNERHYLIPNYGHHALVIALAEKQISDCVHWMKEHKN